MPDQSQATLPAFAAGQCWTYRVPEAFQASRLVIGAIVTFASGQDVVCCAAMRVPQRTPAGDLIEATIPFLPFTPAALAATVLQLSGDASELPAQFLEALNDWQTAERGQTVFTVPFTGDLDRLIALQMASIVGVAHDGDQRSD